MSHRYVPTQDSKRQKQLKWINGICQLHDFFCDCCSPVTHTITFLFEKEPKQEFSPPEQDLIKKCLSGEGDTADGADADTLQEGDLDILFQEPFAEEDATG